MGIIFACKLLFISGPQMLAAAPKINRSTTQMHNNNLLEPILYARIVQRQNERLFQNINLCHGDRKIKDTHTTPTKQCLLTALISCFVTSTCECVWCACFGICICDRVICSSPISSAYYYKVEF